VRQFRRRGTAASHELRFVGESRKWWTLVGACAGLFVLMLDSTVVALALPSIRADLGASAAELQWVMNGYLLTIAVLVVTAGRLGDMFGRKRVFLVGMVLFGVGSVLSGAAQGPLTLIGGRVLQAAGAAPVLSLSLAIVCNAFPAAEQPRALGIWAAVSAVALAIGPVVGGGLVELDWRWIFWVNLPVVLAGIAIVLAAAPESTDPGAGHRVDLAGLLALTLGLGGIVLAMIQSREWPAGVTAALAALGALFLAVFALVERRVGQPIVEFDLFRNGPYFGASAAAFAVVGAYWAVMFFQPQYLQDARGHSPILSGLLILPVTAPMVFISPFSGRLIGRFGARGLMTAGMLFAVTGLVLLTRIAPDSPYGLILAGYLLFGIALGLVYAPMSTAAMAAMPAEKVGIASGVLAMDRIVAGSLALAATGAAFHALQASGDSFTASIAGSTWVAVVLCLVGTGLTWAFVRDPESPGPDPAVAGEAEPRALQHHLHHRRFHL
jgi:EmrB/QacA subfamily drug resistance transporter